MKRCTGRSLGGRGILACLTAILFLALPGGSLQAREASRAQMTVDRARIAMTAFLADPDMEWLRGNLNRAKGVLIAPSILKGGFFWAGSGGRGVLVARDPEGETWSQPVFYNLGSVSWGLQIGGSKSQVILVVLTQRGLESLYASSFKLGVEASVAAGPLGVGVGGKGITADIAVFSRSMGAFIGASLEGAVIAVNDEWNAAYYGKPVRPTDIVIKGSVRNRGALELIQVLAEHSN